MYTIAFDEQYKEYVGVIEGYHSPLSGATYDECAALCELQIAKDAFWQTHNCTPSLVLAYRNRPLAVELNVSVPGGPVDSLELPDAVNEQLFDVWLSALRQYQAVSRRNRSL